MRYLEEMFGLDGKVAVLTGGGGVLASEMGEGLSKAGAKIVYLDLKEDAACEAAKRISEQGGTAIGLKTNQLR